MERNILFIANDTRILICANLISRKLDIRIRREPYDTIRRALTTHRLRHFIAPVITVHYSSYL